MEHAELETAVHEMAKFAASAARSMQSHREALTRHEEILHAQFKAGQNHQEMIQTLCRDVSSLGNLVNSQSELIASMQRAMVKILQVLNMPLPEDAPPGAVN